MRAARSYWFFFSVLAIAVAAPAARGQCIPQYPENVCPCGNGTCDTDEDRTSCPQDCPVGCNNDSVCEAEYGEDAQSCPFDCDEVVCEPSCAGQCGPTWICNQGVTECPCVTCGDEHCDPGEDCPEDCESSCVSVMPLFSASATAAQVNQSITFSADPSRALFDPVPQWDMGNGVHLTGSQISYAYPGPGTFPVILTASETACERTMDSAPVSVTITEPEPITCDLEGIPPYAQRCCGDGTCQGAETPDDCSSDCEAWCGDQHCSVTRGEDVNSCPVDCCLSGTVCAAGCAPIPTFTISNTQPARFETVTFTANASQVQGSVVNWDFGDAHHCEGCPLTATHRYEQQGSYSVRLTVTESVCGSTKVSVPWTITVGPTAPEPWAQILDSGLPTCVSPYQTGAASIHVRNIGGTTWAPNTGDALWIVEPPLSDMLFTPPIVQVSEIVPPGATHTFQFEFGPTAAAEGDYTVVYRMGNTVHGIYGDPASHRVVVSSACQPVPEPPPAGDYTCRANLRHPGGGGVPGMPVEFSSFEMRDGGEAQIAHDTKETNVDGVADLRLSRDPVRPATRLTCRFMVERPFFTVIDGNPEETRIHAVEVVAPTHVDLVRLVRPAFVRTVALRGLKPGSAVARLYQSGPYDKPVVVPEPFDHGEQTPDRQTAHRLAQMYEPFLRTARDLGYDVWLTDTTTGQNIHEQAAEFAQLIDIASRLLEPNGPVIVAGYSLGGLTARLATARYEADPAWRAALGVRPDLPVALIAFGDAPLQGANISFALQRALWQDLPGDAQAKVNLNTCGAQQLLRSSFPSGDSNFRSFWQTGEPVYFNGSGVCDRSTFGFCQCDPGPAVFSVNGDGWAHSAPLVAFSDGHPGPQACYGGGADVSGKKDVCESLAALFYPEVPQYPFFPTLSTPMFRVQVPVGFGNDIVVYPTAEDLAPGARLSNAIATETRYLIFTGGISHQYFGPTFIPFDSALPPSAPFLATWHADINDVHGKGVEQNVSRLFQEMGAAFAAAQTSSPGAASSVTFRPADGSGQTPLEVEFPSADHVPAGAIALTIGTEGTQPPSAYVHGQPARYYTVEASPGGAEPATWREPISVCLDYTGTAFMDEAGLILLKETDIGWVDVTSYVDPAAKRVCASVTALGTFALVEPSNRAPIVRAGDDRVVQATTPDGAEVVIIPTGTHDPDEEPVTYEWRDGAEDVLAEAATLTRVLPRGTHELTLTVRDSRGGEASDTVAVTVADAPATFVSTYQTGNWTACSAAGNWSCTSEGPTGCSRPGTQTRTVTPIAWTAEPSEAAVEPASSQQCSETTTGYASGYQLGPWGACSGTVTWTCTSATASGCSGPGTQSRSVTLVSWTADSSQAQPAPAASQACMQAVQGYVASYSLGGWSACSSTCGSGYQTRSVSPSGYTASAPGVSAPDSVQGCTGESCTCDDMGWYGADQKSQCDSDCGSACTKKQWCGSNTCEPWPNYCWKC